MNNQNVFSLSCWHKNISNVDHNTAMQMHVSVPIDAQNSRSLTVVLKSTKWLKHAELLGEPLIQYNDFESTIAVNAGSINHDFADEMTKNKVDYCYFRNVREHSGLHNWLKDKGTITATKLAPFIDLTDMNSMADYYAFLSAKTRKSRRRRAKKLAAKFVVEFSTYMDTDIEPDLVDQVLNLKKLQLAKFGLSSRLFSSEQKLNQLKNLVLSGDKLFKAVVSVLKCDEKIAAAEIGYLYKDTYYSFLGTMDEDFHAYSPGSCQLLKTIEWAIDNQVKIFDLLPPEDAYKFSWARENKTIVYDILLPFSLKGRLFGNVYYRILRPRIKQIYFWYKRHSKKPNR